MRRAWRRWNRIVVKLERQAQKMTTRTYIGWATLETTKTALEEQPQRAIFGGYGYIYVSFETITYKIISIWFSCMQTWVVSQALGDEHICLGVVRELATRRPCLQDNVVHQ